jgi:hypothetical protein
VYACIYVLLYRWMAGWMLHIPKESARQSSLNQHRVISSLSHSVTQSLSHSVTQSLSQCIVSAFVHLANIAGSLQSWWQLIFIGID